MKIVVTMELGAGDVRRGHIFALKRVRITNN